MQRWDEKQTTQVSASQAWMSQDRAAMRGYGRGMGKSRGSTGGELRVCIKLTNAILELVEALQVFDCQFQYVCLLQFRSATVLPKKIIKSSSKTPKTNKYNTSSNICLEQNRRVAYVKNNNFHFFFLNKGWFHLQIFVLQIIQDCGK